MSGAGLEKEAESARNRPPPPQTSQPDTKAFAAKVSQLIAPPPVAYDHIEFGEDDLDELSNHIVDLIHSGELDRAERSCNTLDRLFPDTIDCLDRRAILLEARGDNKLAAEY